MNSEQRTTMRNTLQSQSTARALSVLNLLENSSEGLGVREVVSSKRSLEDVFHSLTTVAASEASAAR